MGPTFVKPENVMVNSCIRSEVSESCDVWGAAATGGDASPSRNRHAHVTPPARNVSSVGDKGGEMKRC